MASFQKEYCVSCGRIAAKKRPGLSTIEYRRIVRDLNSFQDLRNHKNKLVAIIKKASRVSDYAKIFAQNLEDRLDLSNTTQQDTTQQDTTIWEQVKKWLYEQINILPCTYGERDFYEFLRTEYLDQEEGIDETFAMLYNKYTTRRDSCMNKNLVSRALAAIGLKAKMVRVEIGDTKVFKSTMVLRVTVDDLRYALDKAF